jgi:transglutaminase-like putative cysteine protease
MLVRVTHLTDYRYSQPVAEAYLELRLSPPERDTQKIDRHQLVLVPAAKVSEYQDYFGNRVSFVSLPYRHSRLTIRSDALIETRAMSLPDRSLDLSVQETRQILTAALPFVFDYLQPTEMVKTGKESMQWAKRHLSGRALLRQGLESLMRGIYENFKYRKGATDFSTDLSVIWRDRIGVCQDFAHIMLSVLRTAGLPSRYVCGYIETAPPRDANGQRLVGSLATHAWVEVLLPGHIWVALDPTNNRWCGEQHVGVSFGRDASEAAPIRGTFKGAGSQSMKVHVKMSRLQKATNNKLPNSTTSASSGLPRPSRRVDPNAGSANEPGPDEKTKQ